MDEVKGGGQHDATGAGGGNRRVGGRQAAHEEKGEGAQACRAGHAQGHEEDCGSRYLGLGGRQGVDSLHPLQHSRPLAGQRVPHSISRILALCALQGLCTAVFRTLDSLLAAVGGGVCAAGSYMVGASTQKDQECTTGTHLARCEQEEQGQASRSGPHRCNSCYGRQSWGLMRSALIKC